MRTHIERINKWMLLLLTPSVGMLYWIKVISRFASVQLIVQILNTASGLMVIRVLAKDEYAYYTIASAMIGVMSLLADSGISTGMTSIGGKVWQSRQQFSKLIATGIHLRKYMALVVIAVLIPLMLYMLYTNGAPPFYSFLIAGAVIGGLYYELTSSIHMVVLRLYSKITQIQNLELSTALFRTIVLLISGFTFMNSLIAVLINSAVLGVRHLWLNRSVKAYIEIDAPVNPDYKESVVQIVKHQLPSSIYYCLQSQIMIWIISVFGNSENIAEVGALGRISVLYVIAGSVISSIVLPKFASCQNPHQLLRRYFQILSLYTFFCALLLLVSLCFPNELLWVLGNKYAHLEKELIFISLATVLSNITGLLSLLNSSRAWVKNSWFYIPVTITLQITLLNFLNIRSVNGAIFFGMLSIIPSLLQHIFLAVVGFKHFFKDHQDKSIGA